jgi:alkaline phosphatase D
VRLSRVVRGQQFRINWRLQWGTLAQFDMVDGRQFRSPQACAAGLPSRKGHIAPIDCADFEDPSRTYLGFEQERWLYDGWSKSHARWNVLVQNLLVAPMTFASPQGPALWTDSWNGFGAARQRLIDAMVSSRLANPVTLAGDYHSFWCNNLFRNFDKPEERPVAAEFVVSSITSSGPPEGYYKAAMPNNPQIRYFDSSHRGYMSFDLTPARLDARCMAISDRADPRATLSVLHTASVAAGTPGLA